jgi:hypothetical protein
MGLFSWFINRRMQKESAAVEAAATSMGAAPGQVPQVHQLGDLGDLGTMIAQWDQFKQVTGANISPTKVFDMRGTGMRDEILAAVKAHGVPTDGSAVVGFSGAVSQDPNDLMGLQSDILGVLAKHGVDLGQMGVQVAPGAPPPAAPTDPADLPAIRSPLG